MEGVGEAAFDWDVQSNTIGWDSHAAGMLGLSETSASSFLLKIAADGIAARLSAMSQPQAGVSRVPATGNPYRAQYAFHPNGRSHEVAIMLEEEGRWWPGLDGSPARLRGVIRIITERYRDEQRLRYRGDHDVLTGQLNRSALLDAIEQALENTAKSPEPFAFLLASINGLDVVNDTFGFATGDEMLAGTARLLRRHLRTGDQLGRYASNKFGIIVHSCGPGVMRIVADRLMAAARTTIIPTATSKLPVTLSIGGVCLPDGAKTAESAVASALSALDLARRKRLDSFVGYEPNPEAERAKQRNAALANTLINALDEHRLSLDLQPMVSARTGKPEHYECLLRLSTANGPVSAGEFMPIAEHLGLSRLIDLRTLELAVGLLIRYPTVQLSLNVSGLTSGDNDWLVALHRLTGGNRRITERLTIEITETAAIHDLDQSMVFVDTIKDLGCKAAIDDFGVGYTNFRNLKLLNADLVKIDGAFIKNVCHDPGDQVFIKSMVELAKAFGMKTVAEWVGDAATARFLTEAGIDYLQGFHYGIPASPEKLLGP